METYHRLAHDMRYLMLIVGVVVILIGRKKFRTELFPWVGVLLVVYGSTQYIPGTETWSILFYMFLPILWVSTLVDMVLMRRREGKPGIGFVVFHALMIFFWAGFSVVHYNRSLFQIELSRETLAVERGSELYTMKKEKLRILEGNGIWHLKDGVANIRIEDYELFKKGVSIVTAKQLVDRLSTWTGKKVEYKPDL